MITKQLSIQQKKLDFDIFITARVIRIDRRPIFSKTRYTFGAHCTLIPFYPFLPHMQVVHQLYPKYAAMKTYVEAISVVQKKKYIFYKTYSIDRYR